MTVTYSSQKTKLGNLEKTKCITTKRLHHNLNRIGQDKGTTDKTKAQTEDPPKTNTKIKTFLNTRDHNQDTLENEEQQCKASKTKTKMKRETNHNTHHTEGAAAKAPCPTEEGCGQS